MNIRTGDYRVVRVKDYLSDEVTRTSLTVCPIPCAGGRHPHGRHYLSDEVTRTSLTVSPILPVQEVDIPTGDITCPMK